jgi:hypothetical protein
MFKAKQQSALELLTTYSWAFLIIAVFIAAIAILAGSRAPASYVPSTCNISPGFPCEQAVLSGYNSVVKTKFMVTFTNNLGTPIYFPSNSFNVTLTNVGDAGINSYSGNCTPLVALKGAQVSCISQIPGTVMPSAGSQASASFAMGYSICKNMQLTSCSGTYRTTGFSLQSVSPPGTSLYTISFVTSPNTGIIVINGASYSSGTSAILVSGKYTAYASPPAGYTFGSWSITSTSSTLSSTTLQNATLTLSSNATLQANFVT